MRRLRSRRVARAGVVALIIGAALLVALPALAGFDETFDRVSGGRPGWLVLAIVFEIGSYTGYVVFLRAVISSADERLGWRESYEITLAGVAATRLLATGGAGGIALTAWALNRSGMGARVVTATMATFFVGLYSVFFGVMLLVGLGLATGILAGPSPSGLTVVPALLATAVVAGALGCAAAAQPFTEHLDRAADAPTRSRRLARRLRAVPGVLASGVTGTLHLIRGRHPGTVGALAWWAFDIGVLWACLHAFGETPGIAVVAMAYVVGQLGNLLPLPGGVGGVDGGLIAALLGFGVDGGLAVVAVLSYRAIAFWLPTVPGAIAWNSLRRHLPAPPEDAAAPYGVAGE